ncbi:hypothetical protein B9Q03_12100 [Candidatus Marsarchaeota G2 archaeon OSP_D]|jgi:hypothetical protein|uniref:VapB-type antitoxin n=7 Tax=Candidatus Marsarchaeota group 2 TaxID=2203771 RepID=A0A2R6BEC1_9ARCH|nr:MAG: hypothetical protein B9Q03_12100 [Candidatus Marsarchaeota G2 archaeon OSP_D]PSN90311.1 MAG: hypothetical protein B9Q08_04940 [Candidatus Marsarchaeota G2 archaeon ECH_B_SAG-M15]PSN93264.1 MAG: hypothetical protein B9Q09_06145 [Candidatus Marsarchaeota G2 archaeon ECH_B_SAG-C16]PSN93533.1 MAG: hypothetical protein B9Q06_11750 [Candidatus Marsarchaeota G2 archaeon ECH_B_2]PSN97925.1 MAG: hypothetical protein B9Q07_11155 [Candidatus Marsarchaeota G2 archaeon ECH_B_3]PSN99467.1 MAG: hypot
MSETIRVSKETKAKLLKLISELQLKTSKRVDFDDAIKYLIQTSESKNRDRKALHSLLGVLKDIDISELRRERREELKLEKRRFGV